MHVVPASVVASLNALGSRLWIAGAASPQAVAQLESELGAVLPPSYKEFLLGFGAVAAGDCFVSGIVANDPLSIEGGSLAGDTKRMRVEQGLPTRYLVLQADEEAPYCFDVQAVGQDGEFSVICYEVQSGSAKVVAESFAKWIAKFFLPCVQ